MNKQLDKNINAGPPSATYFIVAELEVSDREYQQITYIYVKMIFEVIIAPRITLKWYNNSIETLQSNYNLPSYI